MPYGGRKGVFGTNPFSYGFPAGDRPDIMIDFATSVIAGGKVDVALAQHEQLPPALPVRLFPDELASDTDQVRGHAHIELGREQILPRRLGQLVEPGCRDHGLGNVVDLAERTAAP